MHRVPSRSSMTAPGDADRYVFVRSGYNETLITRCSCYLTPLKFFFFLFQKAALDSDRWFFNELAWLVKQKVKGGFEFKFDV